MDPWRQYPDRGFPLPPPNGYISHNNNPQQQQEYSYDYWPEPFSWNNERQHGRPQEDFFIEGSSRFGPAQFAPRYHPGYTWNNPKCRYRVNQTNQQWGRGQKFDPHRKHTGDFPEQNKNPSNSVPEAWKHRESKFKVKKKTLRVNKTSKAGAKSKADEDAPPPKLLPGSEEARMKALAITASRLKISLQIFKENSHSKATAMKMNLLGKDKGETEKPASSPATSHVDDLALTADDWRAMGPANVAEETPEEPSAEKEATSQEKPSVEKEAGCQEAPSAEKEASFQEAPSTEKEATFQMPKRIVHKKPTVASSPKPKSPLTPGRLPELRRDARKRSRSASDTDNSPAESVFSDVLKRIITMDKNNLKDIVNNSKSRKFQFLMEYLVKRRRQQVSRKVSQMRFRVLSSEAGGAPAGDLDIQNDLMAIDLADIPSDILEQVNRLLKMEGKEGESNPEDSSELESSDSDCLLIEPPPPPCVVLDSESDMDVSMEEEKPEEKTNVVAKEECLEDVSSCEESGVESNSQVPDEQKEVEEAELEPSISTVSELQQDLSENYTKENETELAAVDHSPKLDYSSFSSDIEFLSTDSEAALDSQPNANSDAPEDKTLLTPEDDISNLSDEEIKKRIEENEKEIHRLVEMRMKLLKEHSARNGMQRSLVMDMVNLMVIAPQHTTVEKEPDSQKRKVEEKSVGEPVHKKSHDNPGEKSGAKTTVAKKKCKKKHSEKQEKKIKEKDAEQKEKKMATNQNRKQAKDWKGGRSTDVARNRGNQIKEPESSDSVTSTTESSDNESLLVNERLEGQDETKKAENGMIFKPHNGAVLDIKVLKQYFFTASEDKQVHCYHCTTKQVLKVYTGHEDVVSCMVLHTAQLFNELQLKDIQLFTGCHDMTMRMFNSEDASVTASVTVDSEIKCMDCNWGFVFIGTAAGYVARFNISKHILLRNHVHCANQEILTLKSTTEGGRRVLLVAPRNCSISIRDAFSGLLLRCLPLACEKTTYSLVLEAGWLYCGSGDNTIEVKDFASGKVQHILKLGGVVVAMVLWRKRILAACYDGYIYVFQFPHGKPLTRFPGSGKMLMSMTLANGKLYSGNKDGYVKIQDMLSCRNFQDR